MSGKERCIKRVFYTRPSCWAGDALAHNMPCYLLVQSLVTMSNREYALSFEPPAGEAEGY